MTCHSVSKDQSQKWKKVKNIQIMTSIKHNKLEHKGNSIHYFVSGKKTENLIVFLHPAFADHHAFDQQVDFFSLDYKIITIDLIGHGLSYPKNSSEKIDQSVKHIKLILEKEGYKKSHFVGVSMGSLIAQYFAFQDLW